MIELEVPNGLPLVTLVPNGDLSRDRAILPRVVEVLVNLLGVGRNLPQGYVSVDATAKHSRELLVTP